MNYTIDFDIDLISVIKYTPKRKSSFEWKESTPDTKKWFGRIKKGLPAGWVDSSYYSPWRRYKTEDLLKEYNHYYYEKSDNSICLKPFVEVHLKTKESICRRFETHNDAIEWIEKIKNKSNKNFETVIYE